MEKVALVTGASSGIGTATVELFASHGYDVVIHYYKGCDRAHSLASEIARKYQVRVLEVKADIADEEDVVKMVEKVKNEFGRIDVLVNNAGVAIDSDFSMKNKGDFQKILDVNLIGPFLVSKYVSRYMMEQGKGAIVNVGSTNGIDSYYPYSMDYDASKAGLHILTKDLAVELAPVIRVNAVAPGWVKTPMNKELDDEFLQRELAKIALRRFAEAEEVAKVIYFLASDEASYVNGAIIVADGGRK